MEFRDYYQALGVARDAPADEIKKAYRKLARKYHPFSKEAARGACRVNEPIRPSIRKRAATTVARAATERLPTADGGTRIEFYRVASRQDFSDYFEIFDSASARAGATHPGGRDYFPRAK